MRVVVAVSALALLPATIVGAPLASAADSAESADRTCTIVIPRLSVDPPLGLKAVEQGTFHSIRKGTVECGSLKGTAQLDGRYGTSKPADCVKGGDGWGVLRVTLGKETIADTFTATFGANTEGQDVGNTKGERIDTKFVFLGTKGSCVDGIREGRITMQAKIRSGS
ncbi:MAG: hypothetical protein ACT4QG_11715 [Sporichthyaceae bacterium]